jgi:hypothetical protein
MAKPRYTVMIRTLISPQQQSALREASRTEGASMSDIVRDALDAYLRTIGPVTFEVSAVTDDGADMPTTTKGDNQYV